MTARQLLAVLNVEADAASKNFNMRTEWMPRQDVFQDVAHHFYVPEIDLFRRQRGLVVRGLDLKSVGRGFKFCSNH